MSERSASSPKEKSLLVNKPSKDLSNTSLYLGNGGGGGEEEKKDASKEDLDAKEGTRASYPLDASTAEIRSLKDHLKVP